MQYKFPCCYHGSKIHIQNAMASECISLGMQVFELNVKCVNSFFRHTKGVTHRGDGQYRVDTPSPFEHFKNADAFILISVHKQSLISDSSTYAAWEKA